MRMGEMKRMRINLMITAVLSVMAVLSAAAMAGSGMMSQEIILDIGDTIEIWAPPALDWGVLGVGTHQSDPQSILVKSTAPYGIKIKADRSRMAEYDTASSSYVTGGASLQQPLRWAEESTGIFSDIMTFDCPLVAGNPATPELGTYTSVIFQQEIGFGDHSLPTGRVYRIVVTYTAVHGL